jgi:hypothetical protein
MTTTGRVSGGSAALAVPVPSATGPDLRPAFRGKGLHERGPIHRFEFEYQPRRLTIGRIQHVGFLNSGRSCEVEHDARTAGHHQPVAECLDQAAPCRTGARTKLERNLGQIHHHAIGVRERKCPKLDVLVEVENEAGSLVVASQTHVGGDRKIESNYRAWHLALRRSHRRWPNATNCCSARDCRSKRNHMICAARQRIHASEQPLYRNRTAGLTEA